jgi:putative membrane protein
MRGALPWSRCQTGAMRFLLRIVVNAVALWVATLLVHGVQVQSYDHTGATLPLVLTYLLVALIFGLVNAIVGTLIRIVAFPIYILTLGLISFIVNGFLIWIVAQISKGMGFGLSIDGFWYGVLAALIITIIGWLFGLIVRPRRRA